MFRFGRRPSGVSAGSSNPPTPTTSAASTSNRSASPSACSYRSAESRRTGASRSPALSASMPGDQAPVRLIAQQRLAEHRRDEIVEEEQELRAHARSAA